MGSLHGGADPAAVGFPEWEEWKELPPETDAILNVLWAQADGNQDRFAALQKEHFGAATPVYVMGNWGEMWRRAESDFGLWVELQMEAGGEFAGDIDSARTHHTEPGTVIRSLWEEWARWRRAERDPERVFSDRHDWPRYLAYNRARQSATDWVARHHLVGTLDCEPFALHDTWPLPIGRKSCAIPERKWGDPGWMCLHDLMPFEGNEQAAFIFECKFADTAIELFGLAVPSPDAGNAEDGGAFVVGAAKFRIRSDGPPPPAVGTICRNLADWWGTLGGQLLGRGRPPGTSTPSRAQFVADIRTFAAENGYKKRRDIAVQSFMAWFGYDMRTYKRWKLKWGSPSWDDLVNEALNRDL